MEKALAFLAIFLLLAFAQCSQNKSNDPSYDDTSERQRERKEAERRGKTIDNSKGWDYDEDGHTTQ